MIGGFHTGFPGVPESTADQTIEALREIDPKIIAPMHCTGIRALALTYTAFPDRVLHNVTVTTLLV